MKGKKKDKAMESNIVLILEIKKKRPIGIHDSTQVNLVSIKLYYYIPGISFFVYFLLPPLLLCEAGCSVN